ncbi:MAG: hypothetical protein LUC94_06945 [Clostridiales bacterium]|nr:hypothetical protein [Clostridiales bacterium]
MKPSKKIFQKTVNKLTATASEKQPQSIMQLVNQYEGSSQTNVSPAGMQSQGDTGYLARVERQSEESAVRNDLSNQIRILFIYLSELSKSLDKADRKEDKVRKRMEHMTAEITQIHRDIEAITLILETLSFCAGIYPPRNDLDRLLKRWDRKAVDLKQRMATMSTIPIIEQEVYKNYHE